MALDPQFVISSNLEEYFVDKDTGLPLSNGTVTYFEDQNRTVLKTVFKLSGTPPNYTYTALPNPITLSAGLLTVRPVSASSMNSLTIS